MCFMTPNFCWPKHLQFPFHRLINSPWNCPGCVVFPSRSCLNFLRQLLQLVCWPQATARNHTTPPQKYNQKEIPSRNHVSPASKMCRHFGYQFLKLLVVMFWHDEIDTVTIHLLINQLSHEIKGTIGCTPNNVPMVFIVFSRDSWGW